MTIDIHALLEKNPITKNVLQPKFGFEILDEKNQKIEMTDYFSVSLYSH